MIITAQPEMFPTLHSMQKECIGALAPHPYTEQEVDTWQSYLDESTPRRFGILNSLIAIDEAQGGAPAGFVSFLNRGQEKTASIECLYVLPQHQGHRLGAFLLGFAEGAISDDTTISVRSTLNAEGFYQKQGYETVEDGLSRAGFAIKIMQKVPKQYGSLRLVQ